MAVLVGDIPGQMRLLVVNSALFSFIVSRSTMKDLKASLDFDRDVAIFREDGSKVTLPLCTDETTNDDALSDKFTSSNEECVNNETESEVSNENNHLDESGPIGEEYIVYLREVQKTASRDYKQEGT